MRHALGDAVAPLALKTVSSNVFTDPEIATVGVTQADVDEGRAEALVVKLALAGNARAKMQGMEDGFVKLFASTGSRTITGGVVVAPRASELVFPIALAVAPAPHRRPDVVGLHRLSLPLRQHRRSRPPPPLHDSRRGTARTPPA